MNIGIAASRDAVIRNMSKNVLSGIILPIQTMKGQNPTRYSSTKIHKNHLQIMTIQLILLLM